MMKFLSRLGRRASDMACPGGILSHGVVQYESTISLDSRAAPGVRFAIHRISFGRRMELSRRVRELSRRAEFLTAGNEVHEKIEANILAQEIDAMYLQWGLVSITGLNIDGQPA